jgi:glycosyltransferase involved in cell wall biosynthesis
MTTPGSALADKQVALGHDYLIQMGGAERVVAALHRMFPQAPLYVSATDTGRLLPDFRDAQIVNTWIRHLPGIRTHFKKLFPIYPFAFRGLGEIDVDFALVSSSGFAKWLRFTPRTRVFCYCHTPPRFFWQTEHYLENEVQSRAVKAAARIFIPPLRRSDYRAAQRVHHLIANSECVRQRIRECYGRDSTVIHPPVRVDRFVAQPEHDGSWLILSRLVAYKRIDRAVRAFTASGRRLVIVGDGPDRARLEAMAGPNVEFKGHTSDDEAKHYLERCYALVFPGLEDFGITPVEAQACGKPVLAYGEGGALETVRLGETGLFFQDPEPVAMNAVVAEFEKIAWSPQAARANAERFSEEHFTNTLRTFLAEKLATTP